MKTLILDRNLQWFWNHVIERFADEGGIFKVCRNKGRVELTDGNELIYISSNKSFLGYHGVSVEIWSLPEWANEETEVLIKYARMPNERE